MIGRALLAGLPAAALAALAAGCDPGATFAVGRDLEPCVANLPTACGVQARCVLDESNYIEGDFPGARRFIVRTDGETDLRIGILLGDRRGTGTELRVEVHEPSCGDRYLYDSGGADIFRLAGDDGELSLPFHVVLAGDHLVEVYSDAYASYWLKVDVG